MINKIKKQLILVSSLSRKWKKRVYGRKIDIFNSYDMKEIGEIKAIAVIMATFDSLREIKKINLLACTHYLNKFSFSLD